MNRNTAVVGAFISGLSVYLAVAHAVQYLVWVALVPLFLVIGEWPANGGVIGGGPGGNGVIGGGRGYGGVIGGGPGGNRIIGGGRGYGGVVDGWPGYRGRVLEAGLAAGAAFSVCAFAWMVPGARAFTGGFIGVGVGIFLLCVSLFSIGCAGLLWLCPPVLVGPVWVLGEVVLQWAAARMPWFLFHIGNALACDIYAIQPVSVIGVAGAGLVVLEVNYLAARAIRRRSWKDALAPLLLFVGYMVWGWWLMGKPTSGPSFTVALVREHIPPEVPWDRTNGNERVGELLRQEDRCIAGRPGMVVWAESAIPWTFSPDDDLVGEVVRRSGKLPVVHVLGMNTAVSEGVIRNSAYCLAAGEGVGDRREVKAAGEGVVDRREVKAAGLDGGGRVVGRYDKVYPLLFIEEPGLGWLFHCVSSDGYSVEAGDSESPLVTPYGKAGVLICNESTLPAAAAARVRAGAQFLLNMSNDGWFRGSWLAAQHFYNARLRAVETRKDIAVNSNNGWSGCIDAWGRIDTAGFLFTMHPNSERSVAVGCPLLPVYACLLFLLVWAGMEFFHIYKPKTRSL